MNEERKPGPRRFSIVIPAWNAPERCFSQAIESCLQQRFPLWELIIVDDGTPETSGRLAERYRAADARVRVLHQENRGVSAARNAGVRQASGDYLLFLDADDFLEPDALEWLNAQLDARPDMELIVFSLWREYASTRAPMRPMYPSPMAVEGAAGLRRLQLDMLEKPLDRNILVFPYCKCVSMRLLKRMQPCFPEGLAMCEDVVFSLKLLMHARNFFYVDRPLYHYRQYAQSAVNRYRPDAVREQAALISRIDELIPAADADAFRAGRSLEVFYAMQRLIVQHYFHRDAPGGFSARRRACARTFARPPYRGALREIRFSALPKNQKIKLLLLRLRLYACTGWLRTLYFSRPGRRHGSAS